LKYYYLLLYSLALLSLNIKIEALPYLNLGSNNFLDGGPLRSQPGFYFMNYIVHYGSSKYSNGFGQLLEGPLTPRIKRVTYNTQLIYQAKDQYKWLLNARPGTDVLLSNVLQTTVNKDNSLGLTSSGRGVGNLVVGAYLQWDPILHKDRAVFVHRLELAVGLPVGKNKAPEFTINPSTDYVYFNPYWAATLFVTKQFSLSWRLFYLWGAPSKKTHTQIGQAIHLNYAAGYQFHNDHLVVGLNGYYLQQITDDKSQGVPVPHSRARTFAIGPGAVYIFSEDSIFYLHLYFEKLTVNRSQGMRFVVHFTKVF
jgi:hypothetical protein